jgi:hypothetical protein
VAIRILKLFYPKQPATLTAGKPWAEMGNREAIEGKDKLKQKKTHGFTPVKQKKVHGFTGQAG